MAVRLHTDEFRPNIDEVGEIFYGTTFVFIEYGTNGRALDRTNHYEIFRSIY